VSGRDRSACLLRCRSPTGVVAGPEAGGTVPLPRAEQGWLWCFIDWLIYDFCGCLKKEKAMAIFIPSFLHSFIRSFDHSCDVTH